LNNFKNEQQENLKYLTEISNHKKDLTSLFYFMKNFINNLEIFKKEKENLLKDNSNKIIFNNTKIVIENINKITPHYSNSINDFNNEIKNFIVDKWEKGGF
ncbi:MAG: hypothetical protein ACRDAW_03305, partial [Metamycoplasmataceae bacterium]